MLSALFNESLEAGDIVSSRRTIALAMQTPGYQNEAFLWKGLLALQEGDKHSAFLSLARACEEFPDRAELFALLGRCISDTALPATHATFLQAALARFPVQPELRRQYWLSRQRNCTPDALAAEVLSQLAYIQSAVELKVALSLLGTTGSEDGTYGVVDYDAAQQALVGWAVDIKAPDRVPMLRLEAGTTTADIPADKPSCLLSSAGFSDQHGGIFIRVPRPVGCLKVSVLGGRPLVGSPVAAIPVFEPPAPVGSDPERQPLDVLLPIYKGVEATLACLESLLDSSRHNQTPHRIIVLDDFSPEPAVVRRVEALARKGRLIHVRNSANLGFIRNMNRGMALHPGSDVIWLNADTLVHGDWIDRLRKAAYGASDVASVTPWSNNGELMSFPQSRVSHPMPNANQHVVLDQVARDSGLTPVEIETGCGFCLYIKRRALDEVGYLDELELRRGYGEESDWCLRARSKGWRHLGATNVFVAHAGGHSFGPEKAVRVYQNNAILRKRYPDAERQFDAFIARDPLKPAREALQERLAGALPEWAYPKVPSAKASSIAVNMLPRLPDNAALPGRFWLIADDLSSLEAGKQWLALARQISRQRGELQLLLVQDTPWEVELSSTGCVMHLPTVDGMSPAEVLKSAGMCIAVTLDSAPRSVCEQCFSVRLAYEYELPLFASRSAGLARVGAHDLDQLRPYHIVRT
ncbi:glycosyltransferase family 2 protein [Pseudomonas sp. Marseille-QA0892]